MPMVPKKTPFDLVPDSFACPNCKSPKAFFTPEQIEIAGFADNQTYGFGTNTWTEAQKSNAIFGGLARPLLAVCRLCRLRVESVPCFFQADLEAAIYLRAGFSGECISNSSISKKLALDV